MSDNRNMVNRKPYRTKEQKKIARATARLCKDGTWRSDAPVSYHKGNKMNKDISHDN